jgi:transposase
VNQLLRPLTDSERAELRASIVAHGVVSPIIARPNGSIIDGHHRHELAAELGVSCPQNVIDCTDRQAAVLAIGLNTARRQMAKKERNELMSTMRELGMPTREIAAAVGVGDATVVRSTRCAPNGARRVDASGRDQPRNKPTDTEQARLSDACVKLRRDGYNQCTIGEALGVSPHTVSKYLRRAQVAGPKVYKEPVERPEPVEWHDPAGVPRVHRVAGAAPIEPPAPYTVSTTIALWVSTLRECRNDNAENRFAGDVADAIAAGDENWLKRARGVVADASAYLARLTTVLEDSRARERAIRDPQRRDDTAALYVVRKSS